MEWEREDELFQEEKVKERVDYNVIVEYEIFYTASNLAVQEGLERVLWLGVTVLYFVLDIFFEGAII